MISSIYAYIVICLLFGLYHSLKHFRTTTYERQAELSKKAMFIIYVFTIIVSSIFAPLILIESIYNTFKRKLGGVKE